MVSSQRMPEGHFEYGRMIVVLFQGEGGNCAPYRKHLERMGMLGSTATQRPPVELIEIKGVSRAEALDKMEQVEQKIQLNFQESGGKATFVHIYCAGRAVLLDNLVQIKLLSLEAQPQFFPMEHCARNLCDGQNVMVWAVFNCGRNLHFTEEQAKAANESYSGDFFASRSGSNTLITHACRPG